MGFNSAFKGLKDNQKANSHYGHAHNKGKYILTEFKCLFLWPCPECDAILDAILTHKQHMTGSQLECNHHSQDWQLRQQ
jgi:hypothetical protein